MQREKNLIKNTVVLGFGKIFPQLAALITLPIYTGCCQLLSMAHMICKRIGLHIGCGCSTTNPSGSVQISDRC